MLSLALMSLLCLPAMALTPRNMRSENPEYEFQKQMPNAISVDAGFYSVENVVSLFATSLTAAFTSISGEVSHIGVIPNIGVNYDRLINHTVSMGASFHYSRTWFDWQQKSDPTVKGRGAWNFYMLSYECRFTYFRKGVTTIYGKAGVGASLVQCTTNESGGPDRQEFAVLPNFQITPLGLRFGRRVAGFVELGFGYRGLVNAGVECRF